MLRGRNSEIALVERWLEGIRAGSGGALHLEGDAGVGKTAILEWTATRAVDLGLRILTMTGHQEESGIAWGGLSQLVMPDLQTFRHFDERPRDTLMRTMRLGDRGSVDDVSVGMSVLYLLTFSDQPTVVIVDDLQWLDEATVALLRFVCRRLEATGVGVISAGHLGTRTTRHAPVVLEPLMVEDLCAIARDRGVALAVAEVLADHALGLPLVLEQMIASLDSAQLTGQRPLPEPVADLGRVDEALLERVASLDLETREVLAAAVFAPYHSIGELADLLGVTAIDETLGPAITAQVIDGDIVTAAQALVVRHPSVRTAVIRALDDGQRRRLHALLATRADLAHRGWHLAAAASGPDDTAARALDALADDAEARGAHLVALRARQTAVEIAESPDDERVLAAARAAVAARLPTVASTLLADRCGAPAEAIRAEVAWISGAVAEARDRWSAVADDDEADETLALQCRQRAALAAFRMYDLPGVFAMTRRSVDGGHDSRIVDDDPLLDLIDCGASEIAGRCESGERLHALATGLIDQEPEVSVIAVLAEVVALALARTGRNVELAEVSDRIEQLAAENAAQVVPALLIARAVHQSRSDVLGGVALAREAIGMAEQWEVNEHRPFALAIAAVCEATAGLAAAAESSAAVRAFGVPVAVAVADYADALTAMGNSDYAAAAALLVPLHDAHRCDPSIGFHWHQELVEVALRLDDRDLAERVNADLQRLATTTRNEGVHAAVARVAALLAETRSDADQMFAEAIARFEGHGYLVTGARARLDWAERLRRDRRRSSARTQIEIAHRVLVTAGARPWAERCAREAEVLGLCPLEMSSNTSSVLTPRELQVARWLVAGMTFKQIGERLFLSPRTAEAHGQAIYRKLSVRGRAELARLGQGDPTLSAAPN